MEQHLTCIGCPMGCDITVNLEQNIIVDISGYTCKRGYEYVNSEITNPVRTVTSTIRVKGGDKPVISVKTEAPIPKGKIEEVMKELYRLSVQAPVKLGDIVLENVAGSEINVVATTSVN